VIVCLYVNSCEGVYARVCECVCLNVHKCVCECVTVQV